MDLEIDRRLSGLMKRAQDGDGVAYEAFLTEAAMLARGFVRKRVGDADAVEDIVQDVLLAIHRHRHTYDPARPAGPWVYAIARNRVFDSVRKRRRREENEVLEGPAWDGKSAWVEHCESQATARPHGLSGLLERALGLLSEAQREIIQLLKIEGYSVAEIAQLTGRSVSSVKVEAHRGYKTLRKLMGTPARE